MERLIKIDRSTIKPNPDYGTEGMVKRVPTVRTITAICRGDIPEGLKEKVQIVSEKHSSDSPIERELILNDLTAMKEYPNIEWTVTQDYAEYTTRHEPKYFYKYENPYLTCEECGEESDLQSIIKSDDEGNDYQYCPHCHEVDTFREITYEKIEDVKEAN